MNIVAVDGPSGAGKSTLSRMAAKKLNYIYIDTGAMYRAVGLFMRQQGAAFTDESAAVALKDVSISFVPDEDGQRVLLNGQDVSVEIRSPQASMDASDVSALPSVRKFLTAQQRLLAEQGSVIMDGRDIGTVVLPTADVKIFLTASAEKRAYRRHLELLKKGTEVSYEEVLADMRRRDFNDSNRAIAPLKPADDAVIIDTSDDSLDKAMERMLQVINR